MRKISLKEKKINQTLLTLVHFIIRAATRVRFSTPGKCLKEMFVYRAGVVEGLEGGKVAVLAKKRGVSAN